MGEWDRAVAAGRVEAANVPAEAVNDWVEAAKGREAREDSLRLDQATTACVRNAGKGNPINGECPASTEDARSAAPR